MRQPSPLPPRLGRSFSVDQARNAGVSVARLRAGDLHRPFHGVRSVATGVDAEAHERGRGVRGHEVDPALVAVGDAVVRIPQHPRDPPPLASLPQLEAAVRAGRRVGVRALRTALPRIRTCSRAQWDRDITRYDDLAAAGWRVIRVTKEELFTRPASVAAGVRQALRQAGA